MKTTKEASSGFEKLTVKTFVAIQVVTVIVTVCRLVMMQDVSAFTNTLEILSIVLVVCGMNNLFIIMIFNLMSLLNSHYEAAPYYQMLAKKYKQFEDFKLELASEDEIRQLCKLCGVSKEQIDVLVDFHLNSMSYDELCIKYNKSYDGINSGLYRTRKKISKTIKSKVV